MRAARISVAVPASAVVPPAVSSAVPPAASQVVPPAPGVVPPPAPADDPGLAREAREAEMADALAITGPSVTAPRRAILEAMLGSSRVRTPEDLLHEARFQAPATSLATVYRTLERLGAAGRIKRATLRSGAVGYAYCGTEHHEHAICVGCGRLRRLSPCLISGAPALGGFLVTTHVLDFYGLCERCAAETADSAGAASSARDTAAASATDQGPGDEPLATGRPGRP